MMKKIFVLFLAIFIMALFSTASLADALDKTGTISLDSGNKADVDLSANVIASYYSDGTTYAAATYNPKGTGREYGTGSTTTYMWYKESGVATGGTTVPIDLGDSYDFATNNWESIG